MKEDIISVLNAVTSQEVDTPIAGGEVQQRTLRQRFLLPNTSGIYFVTDHRNTLLYLGKATSLQKRWAGTTHHRYKQFARKGLDKITISYILAPIVYLDELERQYICKLKPLLNNGRVKPYLPNKSPRLSELQRLLKLANRPLFPSCEFTTDESGNTIPRPIWDSCRGIIAGSYTANNVVHILLVCKQNMGQIVGTSASHKTKRRFYLWDSEEARTRGTTRYAWMSRSMWKFDARQVVFEFVEFYSLGPNLFEHLYLHWEECKIASVSIRKLTNIACLKYALELPDKDLERSAARNYVYSLLPHLQPLPSEFSLDERVIW